MPRSALCRLSQHIHTLPQAKEQDAHLATLFLSLFRGSKPQRGARLFPGKGLVTEQRAASLLLRITEEGRARDHLSPTFPTSAPPVLSAE